jgi:hypothetical protein
MPSTWRIYLSYIARQMCTNRAGYGERRKRLTFSPPAPAARNTKVFRAKRCNPPSGSATCRLGGEQARRRWPEIGSATRSRMLPPSSGPPSSANDCKHCARPRCHTLTAPSSDEVHSNSCLARCPVMIRHSVPQTLRNYSFPHRIPCVLSAPGRT